MHRNGNEYINIYNFECCMQKCRVTQAQTETLYNINKCTTYKVSSVLFQ